MFNKVKKMLLLTQLFISNQLVIDSAAAASTPPDVPASVLASASASRDSYGWPPERGRTPDIEHPYSDGNDLIRSGN